MRGIVCLGLCRKIHGKRHLRTTHLNIVSVIAGEIIIPRIAEDIPLKRVFNPFPPKPKRPEFIGNIANFIRRNVFFPDIQES